MAKKRKGLAARGFDKPIVIYRTPEQHRAIIQPVVVATTPVVAKKARQPRSRAKRKRLESINNGTSSIFARVNALGYRSYGEYLASGHWINLKERWKASAMFKGWSCSSFGCDSKGRLSLHHWTYERMGNEQLTDLVLVCDDCHKQIHALERRGMPLDEATARVTKQRLRRAQRQETRAA